MSHLKYSHLQDAGSHSLGDIKNIAIIASASRAGSSLMFHLLRQLPNIYALTGETVPLLKVNSIESILSDAISEPFRFDKETLSNLAVDLVSDFAVWGDEPDLRKDKELQDKYIHDLALRFALQWPDVDFNFSEFYYNAKTILSQSLHTGPFDVEEFYLELLNWLGRRHPVINPYYYDLPIEKISRRFPWMRIPDGPPSDTIIEEPPFILARPHRPITREELVNKTLLIKDPVNSFRFQFWANTFPNAQIRIIHLVRNPASSINGLYDGWLHRGFFSFDIRQFLPSALNIKGYSDRFAWGKWWWNFDRPPGWQNYAEANLWEVCAFQWASNNAAILDFLDGSKIEHCMIRFEEIVNTFETRSLAFSRIAEFLGVGGNVWKIMDHDLPVIQRTNMPYPFRWKRREREILNVINSADLARLSDSLGYPVKNKERWI